MTDSSSSSRLLAQIGGARSAVVATLVLALVMALDTPVQGGLRDPLFDGYQRLLPRALASTPATVVEIDERTLEAFGQWPWPRTRLAELVDRIVGAGAAAVGLDILMPEPDRLSPRRIVESTTGLAPGIVGAIRALPDNDEVLAKALSKGPTVLGVAGEDAASPVAENRPIRSIPVLLRGDPAGLLKLPQYFGVVRSRPEMETAAAGQGLINSGNVSVVRRVPLLGRVNDLVMANLEMAMLAVAAHEPVVEVSLDAHGVRSLSIGDVTVPTEADGALWLRFGPSDPRRKLSAVDVLHGTFDPDLLRHKLVIVGVTGLGQVDAAQTPVGMMPGAEVRAQLLENIFDQSWLTRPSGARWLEIALFLLMAAACILRVPRTPPREAFAEYSALVGVLVMGGLIAFNYGWLVDVATPIAGATFVFTLVLGSTLAEAQLQRRELAVRLAAERESAARLAGELETARRVQMGMLPESPGMLASDPRIELKAFMEPARSVGGDLYDFFMLDERRLFVMVGDVSGKGIGAAMFMALIKSLCKSAVLRQPQALDLALAQAEDEIKRENPESLFVTLLVLSLDLDTGEFIYCNAGHDPLYGLLPGQTRPYKLDHGGRPPLCVLDDYPYPLGRDRLVPGQMLCMITDGITEATNPEGKLYGHKRLEAVLERMSDGTPAGMIEAVRKDVSEFAAGAEQSDDMSMLALRWNGRAAAA